MTDLIIIGAGPAGMTAALYAIRAGLSVIILESAMYGGQITNTPDIENYPGLLDITGFDLAQNLYSQITNLKCEIKFEKVKAIESQQDKKIVITDQNSYETKTIIIANGAKHRKLNVEGEKEFAGKGVSYCATCDGNLFKGKDVAIIGGGNTALVEALYLSNICNKVYLIHRRDKFRGENHLVESVKKRDNIKILYSFVPQKINGDVKVRTLTVKNKETKEIKDIDISAVFVAIGFEPDNEIFADVISVDNKGYIIAGEDCKTNVKGIYAAGDTRTKQLRQIITAAADGAVAATEAANYINSM